MGKAVSLVFDMCSGVSAVLFIMVVLVQARLYGLKTWVELGLGVGRPVHEHPTPERPTDGPGSAPTCVLAGLSGVRGGSGTNGCHGCAFGRLSDRPGTLVPLPDY